MNIGRRMRKLNMTVGKGVKEAARETWYSRQRCEYCRGWVNSADARTILIDGETRHVHRRHPRRPDEKRPREEGT